VACALDVLDEDPPDEGGIVPMEVGTEVGVPVGVMLRDEKIEERSELVSNELVS
jgi:hypothetical protein